MEAARALHQGVWTQVLDGQLQRATSLSGKLDTLLKKLLTTGSFIFRGKPVAVSELDAELLPEPYERVRHGARAAARVPDTAAGLHLGDPAQHGR